MNGYEIEISKLEGGEKKYIVPIFVDRDDFKPSEIGKYAEKGFEILNEIINANY